MPVMNAYGTGSGMMVGGEPLDQNMVYQGTLGAQQAYRDQQNQMNLLRQQQVPQMAGLAFQQSKWNTLLPYLQQSMGGLNQYRAIGGRSGAGPRINAGPIYDQGKIQQQDNAIRAQGAQATGSQVQDMQNRLAGSGYGANSPLAQALQTQMGMSNQASTADQVRNFNQTAAQQNASHVLQGQTAQEQQYSNRMQEDIARRRNALSYQSSLLSMLGQFL